ncbi:hypothetical protein V6Z11_A11G273200 [Gossypium hirsutum]
MKCKLRYYPYNINWNCGFASTNMGRPFFIKL